MASKKYYIQVPESRVEVSEEVYKAFWSMERHTRTLKEKDMRNHIFSYDAFDTDDMLGAELFPDETTSNFEDRLITEMMAVKLRRCIALLPEEDRNLIQAIYYDGLSERAVSKREGVPQTTVSYRLRQILRKLQNLLERYPSASRIRCR